MEYQSYYLAAGVIFIGGYLYSRLRAYILNRILARETESHLRAVFNADNHTWSDERPQCEKDYLEEPPVSY